MAVFPTQGTRNYDAALKAYIDANLAAGTPGWFNLLDPAYGVDPTGSSDTRAAIQAVIDSIPMTGTQIGGTLVVPPANYRINPTTYDGMQVGLVIQEPQQIRILGYGGKTASGADGIASPYYGPTFRAGAAGMRLVLVTANYSFEDNVWETGPTIEGMNFVDAVTPGTSFGLYARGTNRWAFPRNNFWGFYKGLVLDATQAWGAVNVATPTGLAGSAVNAGANALAASYIYRYVITAVDATGETNQSSEVTVTTTATNKCGRLTWNAMANATGYRIYRRGRSYYSNAANRCDWEFVAAVGLVTTYDDVGPETNSPYPGAPPLQNETAAFVHNTDCNWNDVPACHFTDCNNAMDVVMAATDIHSCDVVQGGGQVAVRIRGRNSGVRIHHNYLHAGTGRGVYDAGGNARIDSNIIENGYPGVHIYAETPPKAESGVGQASNMGASNHITHNFMAASVASFGGELTIGIKIGKSGVGQALAYNNVHDFNELTGYGDEIDDQGTNTQSVELGWVKLLPRNRYALDIFSVFGAAGSGPAVSTADIKAALAAYGWLVAGGASPLDLEGGFVRATGGVTGKVVSGAGKTTVVDGDFTVTPPNGTQAIAHNTTDNTYRHGIRVNGAWRMSVAYT